MSRFVEKVREADPYELCGRMIRDNDQLIVFIDGVGRFCLQMNAVRSVILGLGPGKVSGPAQGVFRLSDSGRGFYLETGGVLYATPVTRVRAVLSGDNRKAPVMRYIG